MDEEVTPLDEVHSDEDILANSSDEEDDSSSVSSKAEQEHAEESSVRHRNLSIHEFVQKYLLEDLQEYLQCTDFTLCKPSC